MPAPSPSIQNALLFPTARLPMLDGVRGLMIVVMTVGHLTFARGYALEKLHPWNYNLVDAAFGFVFLSGIVAGLAYGRTMLREGFGAARARMHRRALVLYMTALGLMAALALTAQVLPRADQAWADWLGPLTQPDVRAVGAAMLLLQKVELNDILIGYVLYLLVAPWLISLCLKGRHLSALALSVGLWLLAQTGVFVPLMATANAGLQALRPDLHLPDFFNLAAWQFLFVGGVALGAWTARQGAGAWPRLMRPGATRAAWISLAVVLACSAQAMTQHFHHLPPHVRQAVDAVNTLSSKERLGVLNLIDLAALGWLTAWLAIAGRYSRALGWRLAAILVRAVLSWRWLQGLGRKSLTIYVWQVLLVYGVLELDGIAGPIRDPLASLIALLVIGALPAPLLLERLTRMLAKPGAALAPAAS